MIAGGGGKVRLKRRDELEPAWDPATADRIAVWECVQHQVRVAEAGGGVAEAARLVDVMGTGRAKVAHTLASVSERKGWTEEALACNVTSWLQGRSCRARCRRLCAG